MKAAAIQTKMRGVLWLALLALPSSSALPAQEPEPPRQLRRLRILELDGKRNGFKVELARETAEKLRDILNKDVDEKKIAELLTDLAEEPKQKLVIKLVAANVAKFKEELNKKMGKAGVYVTITGPRFRDPDSFPAFNEKTREMLREILPEEARGILALLNTNPKLALISPWFWSIAPKEE